MYHYTESGLDNVYLKNGYRFHDTPYGKGVSFDDLEGLHAAIGCWLLDRPKIQRRRAAFLAYGDGRDAKESCRNNQHDRTDAGLWEKNRKKEIPCPAGHVLRVIYAEFIGKDISVRRDFARLAELDHLQAT